MHKFAAVAERVAQICAGLTAFVFFISGVVYLYLGRWTVTKLDFWGIYEFCLNHTWLQSALQKVNSHSLFFPSFLWLADLRFFHGDQLPLFFAGLVLLSATVALLLIPVWRDETVGFTGKVMATLVVIVGNFWMARAYITTSGGFNSMCSLVMAGAALAFVLLPKMCGRSPWLSSASLIVVCAGFVASFSFGTGLAIWPTLFFLAWCLRLPWRSFLPLGVAAVAAMMIYQQLPPHSEHSKVIEATDSVGPVLFAQLCRLVGSPFFFAASGWHEKALSTEAGQSSQLSLWCGGGGLAIAVAAIFFTMIRRDLMKSSLKLTGIALVTFNVLAMALIIAGRADYLRGQPSQVAALRYLFWSTLFWTGLLLMAIQCAESRRGLRWSVYLLALGLPFMVFPEHYRRGLSVRQARWRAECGAVSLVNGIRDEQQLRRNLGNDLEQIYRVTDLLRARRLDMFADGLQDWIGLTEGKLFGGRQQPESLKGQCVVAALVQCANGAPAARVIGQASKNRDRIPRTLVIVDPAGVVCGVARSSPTDPFINRVFYGSKLQTNGFLGYIRDYNPQLRYTVRSADNRTLSEEKIAVRARVIE